MATPEPTANSGSKAHIGPCRPAKKNVSAVDVGPASSSFTLTERIDIGQVNFMPIYPQQRLRYGRPNTANVKVVQQRDDFDNPLA